MELKVLGSSSAGNCYLLISATGQTLAIEAGVRFSEVQQALNFNISDIVGCLITHEHGDHSKHVAQFVCNEVDVYASPGTTKAFKAIGKHHRIHQVQSGVIFNLGEFKIYPFDVIHDAAEPLGFLIHHPESGNILFLTDSFYSEFRFKNLNNIIIEANYDQTILEENIAAGRLNPSIRKRIITSHMSLDTAKELLSANDLSGVNNIVLIHLSEGNSNASVFQNEVTESTGKTVHVASKGMTLNFNKTPF